MTALNFILSDESVIISMDTLSLNALTHKPHKYVTKFLPLPHMNCVICGTGNMGAIIDWFSFVEKNIVANGIYQLNLLTQQVICDFMNEHNGENSCTIYQFGLHEIDNKFYGYAYRSTNEFNSEEINKGIGVKPPDAFINKSGELDFNDINTNNSSIDDLLYEIMLKQKIYDDTRNENDRLGIGGIVQVLYLTKDNIVIKNYKYFDDYEEKHTQMLDALNRLQ